MTTTYKICCPLVVIRGRFRVDFIRYFSTSIFGATTGYIRVHTDIHTNGLARKYKALFRKEAGLKILSTHSDLFIPPISRFCIVSYIATSEKNEWEKVLPNYSSEY